MALWSFGLALGDDSAVSLGLNRALNADEALCISVTSEAPVDLDECSPISERLAIPERVKSFPRNTDTGKTELRELGG